MPAFAGVTGWLRGRVVLEIEVGEDEVEVDGDVGVLGVVAGEVIGVAGDEGVHGVRFADEVAPAGGTPSGLIEFGTAEGIALAIVAAVFADAGVGIAGVVHGTVQAELDVLGKAALGLDLGGVRFGFGRGCFVDRPVLILGIVVEAEAEEFPGGGEPVARFEVRELALHDVDEEADGGASEVGFIADDLGEGGADVAGRVGGFVIGLRPRSGGAPRGDVFDE